MSLSACYQSIAYLLHRSHGPHARCTDSAKQRTVAYLSGRGQWGQMFLLQRTDNPSYSTASAWQCKCGRFSLPLYRKQERSLFTAAMSADCLAASHSGPMDFPYPGASRRSRSQPVFRQVCHGTRDQTAARRFTRPSARDVGRLSSGQWPLHLPGHAPPAVLRRFGRASARCQSIVHTRR